MSSNNPQTLSDEVFDVIVIGAGVVGCAMSRRFTLEGARVAVVEKASDILDGASKANSAILHTGFDAPAGSLELDCIGKGYKEYLDIHHQFDLPLEKTTAHVVAWSEEEVGKLEGIRDKAHKNGVGDVSLISGSELLSREPALANHALAAIEVPGEAIIDPWSAPYCYLKQSLQNGGEVFLSCELVGGVFEDNVWNLKTSRGGLTAKYVINCAGLYGDLIDQCLTGSSSFNITPRKGQFVVYDKAASKLVTSVILPVPTERTKGVVICRTIFGNILVGPTAEDQPSRDDASTDEEAINMLIAAGEEKLPGLKGMPITAVYAGLRPACEFKDYQIALHEGKNWISVGAIRSTGLSGALGIAQHVYDLYEKTGQEHESLKNPQIPLATRLAQCLPRSWQDEGHGEVVCHCELVTKQEIDAALEGPLAAKSLAGLKRQTRVTMGRCQGFFCSARLGEITKGRFENPVCVEDDDD